MNFVIAQISIISLQFCAHNHLFGDITLLQKVYHIDFAKVKVQAVILQAGTNVIMTTTSYAHLVVIIAIWYFITVEQSYFGT